MLKISDEDKSVSLNKRSELVSKCRHENKYILANFIPSITLMTYKKNTINSFDLVDNYSDGVTFVSKACISTLLHICSLFMIVDCWHYVTQDNIKFYHYVRMLTPYDLRILD